MGLSFSVSPRIPSCEEVVTKVLEKWEVVVTRFNYPTHFTNNSERTAHFLYSYPNISLKDLGVYFSKHHDVYHAYIRKFDIKSLSILDATRLIFGSFRPVGEAMYIDVYTDGLAKYYLECATHEDRQYFKSQDALFAFLWSMIMLNIDLHSPVLVNRPKMSLETYITHMKNLNDDSDFPKDFLGKCYQEIKENEIVVVNDKLYSVDTDWKLLTFLFE